MKKLSIALQWLVVAALAALALQPFIKGRPLPERQPETWRNWQGFMALSYAGVGIGEPETYPTPTRMAEQLAALHAAGYRTITPADALAFLEGRRPLPPKALLLLLEGGRKDSVVFTAKPFRKTGFCGTLCLPTRLLEARGAFFLRSGDLHRVAKMKFWSFAGMGHAAIDEIPVGPGGKKGHFLTRRAWTNAGLESPEAFRERVAADYANCRDAIARTVGETPLAYVYPFADAGQGPEADPDAKAINREVVAKHFQLAFVEADQPFNGPGADPHALQRWRVPGNATGAELVRRLEQFAPRADAAGDLRDAGAWQGVGKVHFSGAGAKFAPGAAAWIRASDNWSDVDVTATLRLGADAVAALYARHVSAQSFLRVTLAPAGLRVQERTAGGLRTLYESPDPLPANEPVTVRLRVKGARAWLWRGDEQLAGPLPLAARRAPGRVGLAAETGAFRAQACRAQPLETALAVAADLERVPAENRDAFQALIAPLAGSSADVAQAWRRTLLASAAQGVEIVPRLVAADAATALADLRALREDPIFRSLIGRVAATAPSAELLQGLHDSNLAVVAVVPAAAAAQGSFDAQGLRPDDWILVDGDETETLAALDRLLAVFPAYRTAAFLDSARSRELGIAPAVRYEP